MNSPTPTKIGPYKIIEKIGEGGFSNIYLALKKDKPIAIKCLKLERVKDSYAIESFVREATIASRIKHPNLLNIIDHGQLGEFYFMATPLLLGATIGNLLKDCKFAVPLELSLYIIRSCCQALRHLHQTTVFDHSESVLFHGDLSPDNLILSQDGLVTLVDFGSAGQETSASQAQKYFGKPYYLSPEVLKGEPPSKSTDLYALGVITFFLLFGRRPFEAENQPELLNAILHSTPPRLDCSPFIKSPQDEHAVRVFFNQALHKEQNLRFSNIDSFEEHFFRIHFQKEELSQINAHWKFPPTFQERLKKLDHSWSTLIKDYRSKNIKLSVDDFTQIKPLIRNINRRKHPRVLTEKEKLQVEVLDLTSKTKTHFPLRQISRGGMLLKWEGLIPYKGSPYSFTLNLGNTYPSIQGTAKLLYELPIRSQSHAGFQFVQLTDSDIQTLDSFVHAQFRRLKKAKTAHISPNTRILDVYYDNRETLQQEFTNNIQHGGIFVQASEAFQSGETIFIRLHPPGTLQSILLKGSVVLCQHSNAGKFEVALQIETDNTKEIKIFLEATS